MKTNSHVSGGRDPAKPKRVLVMFGTPLLYGLERAVLHLFDELRPEVQPYFLITRTASKHNLPVFCEVKRLKFDYTQMSDFWSWPRLSRPRSLGHFLQILVSFVLGNLDALRASYGCDAIYLPNRFALCHAVLASTVLRLRRRQVVFEFHDTLERPSFVMRLLHVLTTDVVAGSEYSASQITAHQVFINRSKLAVIRRSARRSSDLHGCPLGTRTAHENVLFIGQVATHKGVDVLVDAFTRVALDYPSAHLHIIGSVADSGFRDRLVSRACVEMKRRITFWGYREDARDFLENAYLLVQPTRPSLAQESAGLAVLEAMAVGVPSVVFRSGALPEMVVHGKTGLVCKDDSVECLESALRTVLRDRGLRERLGAGARDRFESHYAPERARASWLRLLGVTNRA